MGQPPMTQSPAGWPLPGGAPPATAGPPVPACSRCTAPLPLPPVPTCPSCGAPTGWLPPGQAGGGVEAITVDARRGPRPLYVTRDVPTGWSGVLRRPVSRDWLTHALWALPLVVAAVAVLTVGSGSPFPVAWGLIGAAVGLVVVLAIGAVRRAKEHSTGMAWAAGLAVLAVVGPAVTVVAVDAAQGGEVISAMTGQDAAEADTVTLGPVTVDVPADLGPWEPAPADQLPPNVSAGYMSTSERVLIAAGVTPADPAMTQAGIGMGDLARMSGILLADSVGATDVQDFDEDRTADGLPRGRVWLGGGQVVYGVSVVQMPSGDMVVVIAAGVDEDVVREVFDSPVQAAAGS